jgi:mono/diheme cytochrome c family protein
VRKRFVAVLAAAVLVVACNPDDVVHRVETFSDMRLSRAPRPYAEPRMPVEGTVPVTGHEVTTVDPETANRLVNPRPRTAESFNNGQRVYETFCTVCHGATGAGDGPISATNGQDPPGAFPGIPTLTDDYRRGLSDGWIYGVVVNSQDMGKGLMPRYGDKIRGNDRWDVVNFVRQLQAEARGAR